MRAKIYLILTLTIVITATACTTDFTPPPANIQMDDLEGDWQANYASDVTDKLTLNSNGTFRQVFEDVQKDYVFDSGWNSWTIEQSPKGLLWQKLMAKKIRITRVLMKIAHGD